VWEIALRDGRTVFVTGRGGLFASAHPPPFAVLPKTVLLDARRRIAGTTLFYNAAGMSHAAFRRISEWAIVLNNDSTNVSHLQPLVVKDAVIDAPSMLYPSLLGSLRITLGPLYLVVELQPASGLRAVPAGGIAFTPSDMQQFSRWPPAIQTAIRESRLLIGMTPAQSVMSVGVPKQRERVTEEKGVTEEWQYERLSVREGELKPIIYRRLSFAGGKLIRIRETE